MILLDLKTVLSNSPVLNLQDLSRACSTDPKVMRDMLELWIRKGKVRKVLRDVKCGTTCASCDPVVLEYFEWIGS